MMIRGLYTSATGMAVNEARMDTLSNNIANVDTDGFKKDRRIVESFEDALLHRIQAGERQEIGGLGPGAGIDESYTDFSQGGIKETEADLDLALNGDGFFAVETPEGVRYTRRGNFTMDSDGLIVNDDGYPLLGEEGPLQVLPGEITTVDTDGTVYSGGLEVDELIIADFDDRNLLEQEGYSLYAQAEAEEVEPEEFEVKQGFVERSNVEIVKEMVDMIEATRHYETNQRAVRAQDETLQRAVNDIASLM